MAKLSTEEITRICADKGYLVLNPGDYVRLDEPNLLLQCSQGHKFLTSLKIVRDFKNFSCPECSKQEVSYVRKPPEKSTQYRIIAFDQATQHFGVSVYDGPKLVYYDVVNFTGDTENRLMDIADFINLVCKEWKPDFVMFEDIQLHAQVFNGYNTFKVLAELLGVVKVTLQRNKVRHGCVLNKVWQADFHIAGKDRGTQKANVIKRVKELFGIDVNDDIADAILIGKYAVGLHEGAVKAAKRKKLF